VTLVPEWSGDVRRPALSVPAGSRVLSTAPRRLRLIVPVSASLAVTASWEQAADPSDPDSDPSDPATRCVASQTTALPVTATRPPTALYDLAGRRPDLSSLAVVPDRTAADLSPLSVSVRVVPAARFPSPRSKPRTMPVAMRPSERVRYSTRIPSTALLGLVELDRFYNLSRGTGLFTGLDTLWGASYRNGRIVKRRLRGRHSLPPAQPYRAAARRGARIDVFPFYIPRRSDPRAYEHTVGYDIRVHQSGRLVARLRRAIRWGLSPGQRFYYRLVRAENG
jgi:hypothetical protein